MTKRIDRQSGLRKTSFLFWKKTPVFLLLLKRNRFLLLKKNTKIHSELLIVFIASFNITSFRIIHKITYYGIQIWEQRNIPHLCFCKVFLVNGKAWQERAQQTEKSHSHTNSAASRQVYLHAQVVQHLYSFFFSELSLVWTNIRNSLDIEKAEKFIQIFRFYRAEEDNQQNLIKLLELFFSFFQVLHISLLFVLFH